MVEEMHASDINDSQSIPLIDLSALSSSESSSDPSAISKIVTEIGRASKHWGFFQVINHGVPLECLKDFELASKMFFAQSKQEKAKVRRDEANPLGYYDTEHTKNVKDWKEVFDFHVENPTVMPASHHPNDPELKELINRWPDYPLEFRGTSEGYAQEVKKLAFKLLELISLSLGLPENKFNSFFKDHTSVIRINHYPPCPNPDQALGVGPHKDSGALTILAQDQVGGLEVKRKRDEAWIQVKPIPGSYIINIGDIMQVWTNDKYQSVEHRVIVNSEKERFSIVFFLTPAHYVMVQPLEELIDEHNPARYKPYNWGKFSATRRVSNFKKLNVENIQVSHFKVAE